MRLLDEILTQGAYIEIDDKGKNPLDFIAINYKGLSKIAREVEDELGDATHENIEKALSYPYVIIPDNGEINYFFIRKVIP